MQRQRGELVPIGEVVADLDGPVKAIREASPQAAAPLHPRRSGEPASEQSGPMIDRRVGSGNRSRNSADSGWTGPHVPS